LRYWVKVSKFRNSRHIIYISRVKKFKFVNRPCTRGKSTLSRDKLTPTKNYINLLVPIPPLESGYFFIIFFLTKKKPFASDSIPAAALFQKGYNWYTVSHACRSLRRFLGPVGTTVKSRRGLWNRGNSTS